MIPSTLSAALCFCLLSAPAGAPAKPAAGQPSVNVPLGWSSLRTSDNGVGSISLACVFEPPNAVGKVTVTALKATDEDVVRILQTAINDVRLAGALVLGEARPYRDGHRLTYIIGQGRGAMAHELVYKRAEHRPDEWVVLEAVWFVEVDRILRPEFEDIVDSAQLK